MSNSNETINLQLSVADYEFILRGLNSVMEYFDGNPKISNNLGHLSENVTDFQEGDENSDNSLHDKELLII